MPAQNVFKVVVAVLICELAGVAGSVFTASSVNGWYTTLVKPELNPPAWVFGPVWTLLYVLMGIALYMVWREGTANRTVRRALFVFGLQLLLNVLWSVFFFGLQLPLLALIDIALLWLSILWTIFVFVKISKPAALLLLPYLLWVSFAVYLNTAIWILNT